ncbi:MAG: Precorrin-6A reductase [Rhodospirillaceae bacterium]|nr:MAG: Precorrin-6A reductase [Rhodospirillaceae bacterium]
MPTDARRPGAQHPGAGHHVLILGGTRDARQLAEALAAQGLRVTFALHKPTGAVPPPSGCSLHLGSFGGEEGLADFIRAQGVTQWVNALHPHAATMQARTIKLAPAVGLPFHRLERPLWQPGAGDRWSRHDSVEALIAGVARMGPPAHGKPETATVTAAAAATATATATATDTATDTDTGARRHRLLLTVGPQSLADFLPLTGPGIEAALFTRRFDSARGEAFDHLVTWIDGAPDPDLATETAQIEAHRITALVTKNSGGPRPAKLDAAATAGLPVFLLNPPRLAGPAYSRWSDISDAVLAVADLR